MHLKKAETAAIAVTLLFVAITAGFYLGRRSTPAPFSVRRAVEETAAASADRGNIAPQTPSTAEPAEALVNINTADLEELCTLSGIGETLARRIIDHREENGPFARIEDITKVNGIGSGTFAKLQGRITVD